MWRNVRVSVGAILGLFFLCLTGNMGCVEYGTAGDSKLIPRTITIMVSSNTVSSFTPCGCHSGKWGGMPRRGTIFQNVENEVSWPVLFVDTGDVTQGSTSEQQKLKDEYIFQAYEVLDYDVVNVGMNDLRLGMEELQRIGEAYSIPWVSANLYEQGQMPVLPVTAPVPVGASQPGSATDPVDMYNQSDPEEEETPEEEIDYEPAEAPDFPQIFASYQIAEPEDAPGFRIGFIGALIQDAARLNLTTNFSFEAYIDAVQRQVDFLRDVEKVDLVILVSDADNFNNIIPGTLQGIDIVIGGNMRPQTSPNASLNPENPGYGHAVQDPMNANSPTWEVPEPVNGEVIREEPVLDPLQLPLMFPKASSRGRIISRIDLWLDESGRIVDFRLDDYRADDTNEDDPRLSEIARGYDTDILSDELNRKVARTYTGSLACEPCHPGYMEAWQDHGHFNSYDTIAEDNKLDDRSCTECHAVGYVGEPRLLTYDLVPDAYRNVGCEGCHISGGTHAQQITHLATLDPSVRDAFSINDPMAQPIAFTRCTECHTGEWGANFNFDSAIAEARAICQGVTIPGVTLDNLPDDQSQ